ncbi:MAG TPA: sensor histidine kinase [Azospirillaceae bacterium]|nr:sensor histidine kinase [Azospirillaceae bacterium]
MGSPDAADATPPAEEPAPGHSSGGEPGLEERCRLLEQQLRETEGVLRELQHRAKNSLQLVISLLRLQHHRIVDPEARAAYDQTMHRVEVLAVLYRQMHEARSAGTVELARYFREVVETAMANAADGRTDVTVEVEVEPLSTSLYTAMPLGLVVNELVTNGLRHAFPDNAWMRVRLQSVSPEQVRLTVEDNGRGLPPGFDPEQDASTILVEALATQLGADLDVSDSGGSRVQLTLKL